MNSRRSLIRLPLLASLYFLCATIAAGQAPEVIKVEPPGWWVGSSVNPVRLLIRGRNLRGARISSSADGIRVIGLPKINENGTYLFLDIAIAPNAHEGERRIKIATANGSGEAMFRILPPLNRAGRFQGFTTDDVIYLIMTDRFSDGDSSNNDPPASPGLYDRSRTRYYHGGDFEGVIKHLPYLKDLGVTAIWLTFPCC